MLSPNCGTDCTSADTSDGKLSGMQPASTEGTCEPPVGVYEGLDGTLEISFVSLTVRKQLLPEKTERVILFEDIAHVAFRAASGDGIGFLAIREANSERLPSETESEAAFDTTAILLDENMNSTFSRLFSFLKQYPVMRNSAKTTQAEKTQTGPFCPKCGSKHCFPIILENKSLVKYSLRKWYITFFGMWLIRLFHKLFLEGRRFECRDCGCKWFI